MSTGKTILQLCGVQFRWSFVYHGCNTVWIYTDLWYRGRAKNDANVVWHDRYGLFGRYIQRVGQRPTPDSRVPKRKASQKRKPTQGPVTWQNPGGRQLSWLPSFSGLPSLADSRVGRLASWADKLPLPILVRGLPFLEITHTSEDSDELTLLIWPPAIFLCLLHKNIKHL